MTWESSSVIAHPCLIQLIITERVKDWDMKEEQGIMEHDVKDNVMMFRGKLILERIQSFGQDESESRQNVGQMKTLINL